MPILNYTTTIPAEKSVMELQKLIAKFGASSVTIDFDDTGSPDALRFILWVKDNPVAFELPARVEGVYQVLRDESIAGRYKTHAHARRVAWRILKDWCEAQLALIQAGMAQPLEVFLPYAIVKGGATVYATITSSESTLLLSDGN